MKSGKWHWKSTLWPVGITTLENVHGKDSGSGAVLYEAARLIWVQYDNDAYGYESTSSALCLWGIFSHEPLSWTFAMRLKTIAFDFTLRFLETMDWFMWRRVATNCLWKRLMLRALAVSAHDNTRSGRALFNLQWWRQRVRGFNLGECSKNEWDENVNVKGFLFLVSNKKEFRWLNCSAKS